MTSPTDPFAIQFELTADHVKLLRAAYVGWQSDEWGAPEIDPKRPYGNGDIDRDLWTVIEHEGDWKAADAAWDDGYGLPSSLTPGEWEERRGQLRRLHRETETALQIVLRVGSFEPGTFEADRYRRDWRRIDG